MNRYITIKRQQTMAKYIDSVWQLLVDGYADVEGGLHFSSPQELMKTTVRWRLAIDSGVVIAVTIFKAKKGLKLVALAAQKILGLKAKLALQHIIKSDLARSWMELSERAEHFVMKYCEGQKYLINSCHVATLLGVSIDEYKDDGYHYARTIQGIKKTKIALGFVAY